MHLHLLVGAIFWLEEVTFFWIKIALAVKKIVKVSYYIYKRERFSLVTCSNRLPLLVEAIFWLEEVTFFALK